MNIQRRVEAFRKLGEILGALSTGEFINSNSFLHNSFESAVKKANATNAWFTSENIKHAIMSLCEMLKRDKLNAWLEKYKKDIVSNKKKHRIGLVMAGNIPLVGFHDFLSILISGNAASIKLSSDDNYLIPFIASLLIKLEPEFENLIYFEENRLRNFDAVIATGSNNTSRYFEYYFGKYPNIIRQNMNAIAFLNGSESENDIEALSEDVFRYFGLGCRNVSAILLPRNYDLEKITSGFKSWEHLIDHNKYYNNYVYYRTLEILNMEKYYDSGFYIMKESEKIASPLSVINLIPYDTEEYAKKFIAENIHSIQCVVSNDESISKAIKPGFSQYPELWDYADNVDTMEFLISL